MDLIDSSSEPVGTLLASVGSGGTSRHAPLRAGIESGFGFELQ